MKRNLRQGLRSRFRLEQAYAAGESWLSGYSYRKAIVIDNTAGSALSDYQVKVENPIYDETGLVGSWHFEERKEGEPKAA